MRAVRFTGFGPAEVLREVEVPDPVAGPGEEPVRVTSIGVNHGETLIRSGRGAALVPWYPAAVTPDGRLGSEVVGTTAAGRRVVGVPSGEGYAELAVLKEPVEVPDGVGDHEALALVLQGATARQAVRRAAVVPGERSWWRPPQAGSAPCSCRSRHGREPSWWPPRAARRSWRRPVSWARTRPSTTPSTGGTSGGPRSTWRSRRSAGRSRGGRSNCCGVADRARRRAAAGRRRRCPPGAGVPRHDRQADPGPVTPRPLLSYTEGLR